MVYYALLNDWSDVHFFGTCFLKKNCTEKIISYKKTIKKANGIITLYWMIGAVFSFHVRSVLKK